MQTSDGVGHQSRVVVEPGEEEDLALFVGIGWIGQFGAVHGIALPQVTQQALPTPALDEIEGYDPVQQNEHEMAMGMQKIGQQTVSSTAGLAAQPLNADTVVDRLCGRSPFVGAPADQPTAGLAVGVGATVWQLKRTTLGEACGDVFFDGTGEWLYNDHKLGTPPLVVTPTSLDPRWEVSSFLLNVPTIIPAPVDSVKPAWSPGSRWSLRERSITVTSRPVSPRGLSDLIIYSGPNRLYSDQLLWPITGRSLDSCRLALVPDSQVSPGSPNPR